MAMDKNKIIFGIIIIAAILFFVRNNTQMNSMMAIDSPALALQAMEQISCTTAADCPTCLFDFNTNESMKMSQCVAGKCQFSDWCIDQGNIVSSLKAWVIEHPYAWIQNNFWQFALIVAAIIAFILIFLVGKH